VLRTGRSNYSFVSDAGALCQEEMEQARRARALEPAEAREDAKQEKVAEVQARVRVAVVARVKVAVVARVKAVAAVAEDNISIYEGGEYYAWI